MDSPTIELSPSIPDAILPYPEGLWDRAKYHFWRWAYPAHNHIRDFLLAHKLIHPPYTYRQNYVIGRLVRGKKMPEFLHYLEGIGFGNHFIAWQDSGQVASLRKLVDFKWQYHLRIFKDGEIRGHYEFTPESHPLKHYQKIEQEPRREEFLAFLEGWVTPIGCVGGSCEVIAKNRARANAVSSSRKVSRRPRASTASRLRRKGKIEE